MEFGRIVRCAMGSIGNRIPEVGMRFRNSDEAWEFWVQYGGHIGFDVRKRNTIKSRIDGTIISCRFVCSNEGIRRKSQIDHEPKRIRAEIFNTTFRYAAIFGYFASKTPFA